MKTALLLTNAAETQRELEGLLGARVSFIPVAPPQEPFRAKFDALFATWLRLADMVILDGPALDANARWAIEALAEASDPTVPVIFRSTPQQRQSLLIPRQWHVLLTTEPLEQSTQTLQTYLELCDAKRKLEQPARPPVTLPVAPAPVDSYRYRDALKTLSGLFGQRLSERELVGEFLRLVRELLGVGKLALFTRQLDDGLFAGQTAVAGQQLAVAGSVGLAPTLVEHLRLTLDAGLGGWLSREVRILRRAEAPAEARIAREFELLGTDVAVPMFDNDQLLGVLTFSGKITGGAVANDELELVYQLLTQFAQALRNLRLGERLAAHQRLFGEVLANVHSGVVVVDDGERILAINDQARQLLELPAARALVGGDLDLIPGRVGDVVFEALRAGDRVLEREVMLPRVNRPLRVHVTRFVRSDTGHAVAVALLEDLTQFKLEQARARETQDKEFMMRLAFRLSHELKNSLAAIKSFAQLLPEMYNEKEFRDQFSGVVANEVNRVDVLVNNLMFFSHPLGLVHEDVVLTELLETCIKNVTAEFARKHLAVVIGVGEKAPEGPTLPVVQVKKNFGHKLARLEGDRLRLMQACEQLLRNALQSMPAGGRINITTSDAATGEPGATDLPAGGAVKIEILDTGEGIALEHLKRVTEPFFTTRNVGVGLGLTIVKKIVERHSGRLEVDSLLGRGTTVGMVLPVKSQPHPEDALLQQIAKLASVGADSGESNTTSRLTKSVGNESGERS
ncbi:MAG: Adaptive-response sensory-kinase SasA [Verrucomicrobiae bacterium]|nr:Adaptive-response sensory-kinase SasA [Verrucomicrobiae bacterium]